MQGEAAERPPSRWRLARPWPVYPILLAVYAVLFLYSSNLADATLPDVLPVVLLAALAASAALAVTALMTRDLLRAALIVGAVEVVFFGYRNLAIIFRGTPAGGRVLQAGLALLVLAAFVVAWRRRDLLPNLARLLNLGLSILLIIVLVTIVPHELQGVAQGGPGPTPGPGASPVPDRRLPDIYYLVFDRYGSEESLETRYGITEHGLVDWLEAHGFYVAHESTANYHRTLLSMAATLDMAMHDGVTMPSSQLGDHAVGRFLKDLGYRYIHIGSWYGPTQSSPLADEVLGVPEPSDFARAMHRSTLLPALERLTGFITEPVQRTRHHEWNEFGLDALERVQAEPGPKFVLGHVLLPHPPYIFDRTGRYLTEREARRVPKAQQFLEQKLYLDQRLEAILGPLLALPEDERPIIIVQGDEGPYPVAFERAGKDWDWAEASDDDLVTKFGILNAQYWPGQDMATSGLYPRISAVNTFRLLFDKLFGADLPLLPDRSVAPSASSPGGVLDVTDRVHPR